MTRSSRAPLDRVRYYTWGTLGTTAGVLVLVLSLELLSSPVAPLPTALLGLSAAVVVTQYVRISAHSMPGLGVDRLRRWEVEATVAVALGAWALSVAVIPRTVSWAMLPSSVLGALAAHRTGWRRWGLVLGGGLVVALVGAAVLPHDGDLAGLTTRLVICALMPLFFGVSNFLQVWLWSVVRQLDDARQVAAELAVAEERLRFAADLHDIQGHHLQAIALKGELAERLIGHDDDAARAQAAEVSELARTALRETRAVVYGYRRTSLSTEIGNAVDILRAAGISTTVDGSAADVPPPLQPLFGALVREGTTNILRHSSAGECALVVRVAKGRVLVELRNDGVAGVAGERGSGLAGLRERFATVGGLVRADGGDGVFRLVGEAAAR
ncbi:histidine kinase [Actinokineospora sp. NBRC 105648]|uniref:sensor histidine kinase n=1 Tax=Actinokineospora sp. NBRC 105648 TaxID=3032206 RepID=UPI00249FDDA2|nr:histidine kinase [Actinokineospora sp. NBRC 105648]GLZ40267.1 hypothetical protein Acsp05_38910 [Actinokineospora sp. NBRC 105648]